MNSNYASNDPIFYAHHANVDKIWYDWQKQSEEHRNSYSGDKNRILSRGSPVTAQDMLDLKNLKYVSSFDHSLTASIAVEYVDMDTSGDWGRGNTLSIDLSLQQFDREAMDNDWEDTWDYESWHTQNSWNRPLYDSYYWG